MMTPSVAQRDVVQIDVASIGIRGGQVEQARQAWRSRKRKGKRLGLWLTQALLGVTASVAAHASPVVVQPGGEAGYMFLSASGGVEASSWRPPVENVAALPTCDADSRGHVRLVLVPAVGTTPRAYSCNGTSWTALAVDDNGNLVVPGTLTAQQAVVNQLAGNLEITTTGSSGAGCSPNGRLARDPATGEVLFCRNGIWREMMRMIPGEGERLQLLGANGQSMWLQNINGRFRLVNSNWTQELFSVDQAGNVSVAGTLTAPTVNSTTVNANRLGGNLEITTVAAVNTACGPNGRLARDTNGLLLSCQSGVWRSAQGSASEFGQGQFWYDVRAWRANGVYYVNDTQRTIWVVVTPCNQRWLWMNGFINGVYISTLSIGDFGGQSVMNLLVPPGQTYMVQWGNSRGQPASVCHWMELR